MGHPEERSDEGSGPLRNETASPEAVSVRNEPRSLATLGMTTTGARDDRANEANVRVHRGAQLRNVDVLVVAMRNVDRARAQRETAFPNW